jgi:hypothetical protein
LDIDRFLKGYLNVLLEDKKDSKFETLRVLFNGLSGIRTAKLINFASLCMDGNNEFYCEIGTYRGYTLLSAGYENRSTVVGIDNEKPEWCSPELMDVNGLPDRMNKYERVNYRFFKEDFRNVKLSPNVGVLFIDGDHNAKEVKDALEWAKPCLVKDAVVIFDDVNVRDVGDAILDWAKNNPNDELIFYSKAFESEREGTITNHYLANGIAIMRHHA